MTRPLETADGTRGYGSFPAEWGSPPPGGAYSEERARWVREKVAGHCRTAPLRELARRDARLLWTLRIAELERKRP